MEGEWSPLAVGDGKDPGVAPAPADADRLGARHPFLPATERCAPSRAVLSISTSVGGPPAAASVSNTLRYTPMDAQRTSREERLVQAIRSQELPFTGSPTAAYGRCR